MEWEITMYWALVGLAHALAFRAEIRARALTAARLDAELSQAKLQALQQQMHPHFLFNTLQSVAGVMHKDVEAAERMIERLGGLLRASLRRGDDLVVPLARELEYAGHYLAIEQMNMGDRLQVEQDIPAETLPCAVPELLVQPLVENAVRHGIAPMARGGTVRIVARRDRDMLVLSVIDDGAGLGKASDGAGIALENTRRRLEMLYPDRHAFEIGEGPGGRGVVVEVMLPFVVAVESTSSHGPSGRAPERTVTGAPG
jgi:LytS/YehU family sensor histidine kinase